MAEGMAIEDMHAAIMRLADQVTMLNTDRASPWPKVAGVLADEDGLYHAYLGATGIEVRASFIEDDVVVDRRRMKEIEGTNKSIESQLVSLTESVEQTLQEAPPDALTLFHKVSTHFDRNYNYSYLIIIFIFIIHQLKEKYLPELRALMNDCVWLTTKLGVSDKKGALDLCLAVHVRLLIASCLHSVCFRSFLIVF